MSAQTLTALIQHSIRVHDAQQEDAGVDPHNLAATPGPAHSMLLSTYGLHANFVMMLKGIHTRGESAQDIIDSLNRCTAILQEHIDQPDPTHEPTAAALVISMFISELGAIIATEGGCTVEQRGYTAQYGYTDWQREAEVAADGRKDVHYIEILDPDGEELAVIVHRTEGGEYPLEGPVAVAKMMRAEKMVGVLNSWEGLARASV